MARPIIKLIQYILSTISDKIVETLYVNRVTSENKRIRTPPLSPSFKVGMFVVFYRQLEQGHNIARRGWGRKAIFPPFEVHKTQKSPVLGEVSQLILSSIVACQCRNCRLLLFREEECHLVLLDKFLEKWNKLKLLVWSSCH